LTDLRVFPDAEAASRATSALLAEEMADAKAQRGAAHLALPGGGTPKRTFQLLGEDADVDWRGVELWMGDERIVPDDDPESNIGMVRAELGERAREGATWHRVQTELGVQGAADAYDREWGDRVLDVAFQGVGPDGHTASLFGNHPLLDVADRAVAPIVDSPKPPPERVTFTVPVISAARRIVFLITGEDKASVVTQIMAGPDRAMPSSLFGSERTIVIADEAAAAQVDEHG
jgi:6-phosphogluconolactonase